MGLSSWSTLLFLFCDDDEGGGGGSSGGGDDDDDDPFVIRLQHDNIKTVYTI